MSGTLRDNVARAICDTWGYVWDGDPEDAQTAPETYDPYDERPDKVLYRKAADAALAALRTWLAENGMVVVPRFPTFDMEMAVKDEHIPHRDIYGDLDKLRIEACGVDVWQAMLSAAPGSGLEDSEAP